MFYHQSATQQSRSIQKRHFYLYIVVSIIVLNEIIHTKTSPAISFIKSTPITHLANTGIGVDPENIKHFVTSLNV